MWQLRCHCLCFLGSVLEARDGTEGMETNDIARGQDVVKNRLRMNSNGEVEMYHVSRDHIASKQQLS